jgi:hypothetical protein
MKALYIIVAIVVVAVVGAGGFYGGVVYAQSQTQNTAADFTRLRGAGNGTDAAASGPCGFPQRTGGSNRQASGQGGGQGGFQGTPQQFGTCVARGTVKSIDGSTIQISTPVSVVTVKVDGTTIVSKTVVGSPSDLKTGDRVTVYSTQSGDSPTASMVQLQGMPGQTGQ